MKDVFFVVMAGGSGTRFWPKGRQARPKQLLAIEGSRTLVQATLDRIPAGVPRENVVVVTNVTQVDALREQVDLPDGNVLGEPCGRNTAACIGLAAVVISERCGDGAAVMVVLAADHVIAPPESFHDCLERAVAAARKGDVLVTIGIEATHAAEGYGYIALGDEGAGGVYDVVEFKEKPEGEEARRYFEAGFLWNSGIFCWRVSTILDEIRVHMPRLAAGLDEIRVAIRAGRLDSVLERVYPTLPDVPIDKGVLEKATRRLCVRSTFEWDDVGSLAALARHNPVDDAGNVVLGESVVVDARRCIIDNEADGVVAVLGVEDVTIVRTADAVLVVRRGDEERVREIVAELRERGAERHL